VEDIDFQVDFVAGKFKKIAKKKRGLERKISWALNVFTLPNSFLKAIFENVKNKECVHTWANGTGYTSEHEKMKAR